MKVKITKDPYNGMRLIDSDTGKKIDISKVKGEDRENVLKYLNCYAQNLYGSFYDE